MNPVEVLPEMTLVLPKALFKNVIWARRICVDLDGVICHYPLKELVWEYFQVDIEEENIYAYDLADVLGVSHAEIDTMFKEQVYGKPNFIDGAVDTLREWKSRRYELLIFSNRVMYMGYDGLARWLIDWRIPFTGIDGGQGAYDFHIDDSPSKLMETDSKIKLLYNQPWNKRCWNVTGELVRVKSWEKVRQAVNGI